MRLIRHFTLAPALAAGIVLAILGHGDATPFGAETVRGSPALDAPPCVRVPEARGEEPGDEELGIARNGEYCAYPLRMMAYHRVVNDHLGGPPILVSFDPDTSAGRVFDPILDGKPYTFDAVAPRRGLPVLIDRETRSLWSAISGEALSGPLAGKRLTILPSLIVTWERWRSLHPDSWVLAEDPKRSAHYTERTTAASCPLPAAVVRELPGRVDPRLKPDTLVLGIDAGGWQTAYPLATPDSRRTSAAAAIPFGPGDRKLVLFADPGASAAAVYIPTAAGRHLTFIARNDGAVPSWTDAQTHSRWTLDGRCVDGPMKGQALTAASFVRARWYAWAALYPKTQILRSRGRSGG